MMMMVMIMVMMMTTLAWVACCCSVVFFFFFFFFRPQPSLTQAPTHRATPAVRLAENRARAAKAEAELHSCETSLGKARTALEEAFATIAAHEKDEAEGRALIEDLSGQLQAVTSAKEHADGRAAELEDELATMQTVLAGLSEKVRWSATFIFRRL